MDGEAMRLAIVDLGTVSSRLLLAEVEEGSIASSTKRTVITDLGEGVDATGRFSTAAIGRVVDACTGFCRDIDEFAPRAVATTLTSAARDASNGGELLAALEAMGLSPQVISGEVEAALTFLGVAHDFPGERIAVADSGGGSTELVVGRYAPKSALALEQAESIDIGCRRVTERLLATVPPVDADLARAREFAATQLAPFWSRLDDAPDRLVAVGGTVTTLVAHTRGMQVYDSSLVHLSELRAEEVERSIDEFSVLSTADIAALPGIQPKRAPVILAGAIVIAELMRVGGYDSLTVSENSLMAGMAATMAEAAAGERTSIGWTPRISW